MTKIVVPDIDSGYNLTQINVALQALATELNNKVLYRANPSGEPNSMNNNLDMNSFQILNLPAPATQNSPARLRDVQDAIAGIVPASLIPFTPAGTISSTTVQSAIEEVNTEAAAARTTIVNNLSASTGSSTVGHIAASGAAKTVQSKLRDIEIAANDFAGVDPTGSVDSYTGLVAAIAACPAGSTLVLNGFYRCSASLVVNKNIKFRGRDSRIGNLSDANLSKSALVFTVDVAAGIDATDVVLTIEDVSITSSVTSTGSGVRVSGASSALIFKEGSIVQSFNVGLDLVEGDYHKIEGTATFCKTCIRADACYNMVLKAPTLRANGDNSNGIVLLNGCSVTMLGGSVENFTGSAGYGIGLFGGSTLSMLGTYFEGSSGANVLLGSNTSLNAVGCHVYLNTGTTHFIRRDGAATGVRIFSRNHRFVYPTDTSAVSVYDLNSADSLAFSDIAGDNWESPGANVKYLADGFFGGNGPASLTGSHSIVYPMSHPLAHKNLSTVPRNVKPAISAVSGTPEAGMQVLYAANGFTGDDPISLRTANGGVWGANPYSAVYHKGQWEKVGLRMTNIANVSGGATVDAEARTALNSLLTQLRAAGVMV